MLPVPSRPPPASAPPLPPVRCSSAFWPPKLYTKCEACNQSAPRAWPHAGAAKPRNSLLRELVLGFLAGMYIGIGFSLCMLCAGQLSAELRAAQPGLFNLMYGVFGFPLGLSMVVINGASLFTSNVAYMTAAVRAGHWEERVRAAACMAAAPSASPRAMHLHASHVVRLALDLP
jgi:hypothetical protein